MAETIDVTPTWSALLPVMLDVYANNKLPREYTKETLYNLKQVTIEFERMAAAADKYNELVKASKPTTLGEAFPDL